MNPVIKVLKRLVAMDADQNVTPPTGDSSERSQARKLLDNYLREVSSSDLEYHDMARGFETGRLILESTRETQVGIVLEAIAKQVEHAKYRAKKGGCGTAAELWRVSQALRDLLKVLLRKKLPFTAPTLEEFIDSLSQLAEHYGWPVADRAILLRAVEDFVERNGMADSLKPRIQKLRDAFSAQGYADSRKAAQRLDALLSSKEADGHVKLTTGEPWTQTLIDRGHGLDTSLRPTWEALLAHCAAATSSKPSKKWLQEAKVLIDRVGFRAFATIVASCLNEIGKPGPTRTVRLAGAEYLAEADVPTEYQTDPTQIHDTHADLLRGLVWCTSLIHDDDRLVSAVGDAAEICFKKIPGFGPRSPKIGNACLFALASVPGSAAVSQLTRLKTRAKHASTRKQLGKAMDIAADKAGMSTEELEEIAVPTCGLTMVGHYEQQLGDLRAVVQVTGTRGVDIAWIRNDGKAQKSVPVSFRTEFAEQLKAIKRVGKEIEKMLPVQRDRLEQLFLRKRRWSFRDFRARYLDHPLMGTLARRLIWRFEGGGHKADGIWDDGNIVDVNGHKLSWLTEDTQVALWHPLSSNVEEIASWRNRLETTQVRQPFKQAHREVYLLTDAERETATYSNRFAAHILKQHQFRALCQARGWKYDLQGAWDSHNTPWLDLSWLDMRAEFWVDAAGQNDADTAASGIYLYISTDQVRFHRVREDGPMNLVDVPPLVFSEIMRDVDLFVGVASVGNDPNWSDGGPDGRYAAYWQSYSFGDLSATSQTRKEILERLVPRFKIAERCSFSDRFIVVKGDIRTYKIHLGSGNILMSPNDQYLCIVPKRGIAADGDKVFLPFEGDQTVSVILSKAFLLAEDTKIKDRTIVSQIRGR